MNILDLPNEILLIIFEKLKTVDILYSLVDVHHRFNKIVFDLIDMRDVNFVRTMDMYSFHDCNYSIDTKIISTLCHQILFRIADKIRQLTIEHNSMDQILSCCTYPQLDTLTLVNCDEDKLYEDLQSTTFVFSLMKRTQFVCFSKKMSVFETFLPNKSNVFILILKPINWLVIVFIKFVD